MEENKEEGSIGKKTEIPPLSHTDSEEELAARAFLDSLHPYAQAATHVAKALSICSLKGPA